MLQNINIKSGELNELIIGLEMNEKDVNDILNNSSSTKEAVYLSIGPDPPYSGSYYGAISIKDF